MCGIRVSLGLNSNFIFQLCQGNGWLTYQLGLMAHGPGGIIASKLYVVHSKETGHEGER